MLRDVFYYGDKPNVHPREKFATSLEDARSQCTTEHFWIINEFCNYKGFDWDWDFEFLPDEEVWAENHNNVWPSQHQKDSGTWLCPTEFSDVVIYRGDVDPVKRKNEKSSRWTIVDTIDEATFDFSWHPDSTETPYIYVWGNKFNPVEIQVVIEYHTPNATERKYMTNPVELLPQLDRWKEIEEIDKATFDFSWRPDPREPSFIYIWGNTQYSGPVMPTISYQCPGATVIKYLENGTPKLKQNIKLFENTELIKEFDYSWRPDPTSSPYIYQFGTQWQKTHGPRFVVAGATSIKYVSEYVATVLPDMTNWHIPPGANISKFDFSWHPDATSDPYIYQFGTALDDNNGPRYITPGNTGLVVKMYTTENVDIELKSNITSKYYIITSLEDLIEDHPDEIFWALNPDIDYASFDFNWLPSADKARFVHAFGSEDNKDTQTYFVNAPVWLLGHRDINYVEDVKLSIVTKIDMFFVDRGNEETQQRFNELKVKFPNIQKTRYLNSWVDTINRCINRASSNLCWILNSELDYNGFDFNFYPNPWQMKMTQVFGTQWSHWGTTFMVNRETFAEDTKYVKIIEHLSNLNFVKDRRAQATNVLYDLVYIDHGNLSDDFIFEIQQENRLIVKYDTSYLATFKNMLDKLPVKKEHYVWVVSTVCDYTGFDFTYICDPFARDQLHVFPSDRQKAGDTFLVDVNKLRELITDMTLLEEYQKINYNQNQRVKRLAAPVIISTDDTHVNAIKNDFKFPYAVLKTSDNTTIDVIDVEPMSLWSPETKNIIVTSAGGTRIIVPSEAKNFVKKELYDYPYIINSNKLAKSNPMDIVFLSNGEIGADENYEHLLKVTHGLPNKVTRVDGVDGRVAAYHAAAEASTTPWMFTVFAKLKVNQKFDWNWQPDRLQIPKHYIFNATNPVNGLVYGHQAMIAYNKKIVLCNQGRGLDFTLDDDHEVIDMNSGIANFNTDAWSTWRAAFREAIKLRADSAGESKERLGIWLNKGEGNFAEYSMQGAQHALEFYEEVEGDIFELRLSYDWPWLKARFDSLYAK